MADNLSSQKETLSQSLESQKSALEHKQDIPQDSENIAEGLEGVAEIIGEAPSEVKEKSKSKASGSFATNKHQSQQKAAIKPIKLPTLEVMRGQIATQVKKEIRQLEKEANRMMMNPAGFNPFKLNGVIAKIRELKDILANLAFATMENLKGWWMKFVRNSS